MTTDIHEGPLEPAPAIATPVAAPARKTWREKRWERRRRRIWFEEALGWILVPIILVGLYYLVEALLGALGTSVSAIADGIRMIVSNL
jgi:hypothetical protein